MFTFVCFFIFIIHTYNLCTYSNTDIHVYMKIYYLNARKKYVATMSTTDMHPGKSKPMLPLSQGKKFLHIVIAS